ncbi:MAG: hypothetical protein JWP11_700 [Frankiales bacterium]|nr:hypothetical protein [Frankiales bacterium]
MTVLAGTASRWVWRWCVVYTACVPGPRRDRRRREILSHLWESEQAAVSQREVLLAFARGIADDLAWSVAAGVGAIGRVLLTPTPYVVLAGACPIVSWLVSAFASRHTAQPFERLGGVGALPFLLVALVTWRRGQSGR